MSPPQNISVIPNHVGSNRPEQDEDSVSEEEFNWKIKNKSSQPESVKSRRKEVQLNILIYQNSSKVVGLYAVNQDKIECEYSESGEVRTTQDVASESFRDQSE